MHAPRHAGAARRWVLVLAFALAVSGSRPAAAKAAAAPGAQARFEAQSLMALGRYREACDKFEESQQREPALATEWSLADCWTRTKRAARAWALYREVAANQQRSPEAKALAAARAKALEPRLAALEIRVAGNVEGLHVSLDGEPVAPLSWGGPLRVDVGSHQLSARAPGHQPWQRVVQVSAGSAPTRVDVPALEVGTDPQIAAATTPAPLTPPLASDPGSNGGPTGPDYTATYVAGGIGVAGLTVSAVSAWIASSKADGARKLCSGVKEACRSSGKDDPEALKRYAKNARTVSEVALGVGALGLVTGGVFLYLTKKKASESEKLRKVKIAPNIGRNGVGVNVSGSF